MCLMLPAPSVIVFRLISQSELPERDDVAMACFDIVFYNVALGCVLYLLLLFFLTTHLKGLSVYFEIANT